MKIIGMIGGTTWVSTIDYYKIMNREVNKRLGGNHTAKILLYSINFDEAVQLSSKQDFKGLKKVVDEATNRLIKGGADCLILGANTMHLFADRLQKEIDIPIIHIAEKVAEKIREKGLKKVALLGTRITMTEDFYKDKLKEYGIETIIPDEEDMDFINYSIYEELGHDIFKDTTKKRYIEIMHKLAGQGAEGFILGCTEIPLIIKQENIDYPVFDTLKIHAISAVDFALNNNDE